MSAFIGDMTPEAGNETQTDESGPDQENIITETQEDSASSSQQTNESLRPNLRHRMLQKTGLSEPQPKDDTIEYPADDEYGLFEQVSNMQYLLTFWSDYICSHDLQLICIVNRLFSLQCI